jgi:predicted RNA methylase
MRSDIMRLLHLREQTEAVGEEMRREAGRFEQLADPASKPRAVSAFNLFQTPPAIADTMAGLLMDRISSESVVLEPSAGLGRLYSALRDAGHNGQVILVEQSAECCRELYEMTREDRRISIKQRDFLETSQQVDGVIMNPPFKQGRDVKHVKHALSMLRPGGVLVGLCYDGVKQNKHIKPLADMWKPLPAGSFKSEGTRAGVVLFMIGKGQPCEPKQNIR